MVAPPESNATPINSVGEQNAKTNKRTYAISKTIFIEKFKTERNKPIIMKIPTPPAITKTNAVLFTDEKTLFT